MTTSTSFKDITETARSTIERLNNAHHQAVEPSLNDQTLKKLEVFLASNQKSIAQLELLMGTLLSVMREKELICEEELLSILQIENSKMDMTTPSENNHRITSKYRYHT